MFCWSVAPSQPGDPRGPVPPKVACHRGPVGLRKFCAQIHRYVSIKATSRKNYFLRKFRPWPSLFAIAGSTLALQFFAGRQSQAVTSVTWAIDPLLEDR
jgi:hypothetical protein